MQGKVEICGVNTAKLKVLSNDEMVALLRRTKEGDLAARQELISGNLRLVLSVIQKFLSRGENVDDLFQVGCIGLIKAIDNFDISQNVRFSTYGVPMNIIGRNIDGRCVQMAGRPRKLKLCNSQFYYHKAREAWRDDFIAQYRANQPGSASLYNQTRNKGTPSWGAVAGLFEIRRWTDWLNYCDITPYINKRAPARGQAKAAPIYLTREVNISGDPKLSAFLEENMWQTTHDRTKRRKPRRTD